MAQQQPPMSAEAQAAQIDQLVSQYLRKKGYTRAEQLLKEEARLQSIEGMTHHLNNLTDMNVANYIMFYNPNEQYPSVWSDTYAALKEWVESSLDMYKPELMAILFPVFVHCYLDLVEKGHTEAARRFFQQNHEAFLVDHREDINRLQGIITEDQMKESEIVKLYRRHKLAVQMSSYSFELLLTFLHDQNAMTLLSIVNRYISINVLTGQPQRASDIRAMQSRQMEEMNAVNKSTIHWGILEDQKKLLDRVDETPEERERRERDEAAAAAAAGEEEEDAMDVDEEGDKAGGAKAKRTAKKDAKAAGAAAKKKRKRGDEDETVKAALPMPKMSEQQELQVLNDLRNRVSLGSDTLPSICFYTHFNTYANMNCTTVSSDGSLVASGFSDSTVRIWDLYRDSPSSTAYKNWLNSDGRSAKYNLATGARDDDNTNNSEYSELIGHSQPVYSLSFSPDNRYLLSSSADGTARLWSTETRTNLVAYRGHSYPIWSAQFAPVGFYFATASHDRTARLWRTDQIFPIRVFAGHLSDVNTVQFHPNCNYLMTGSSDKCLRFWEVHTGNCVRIFTGHLASVHTIAMSPDGRIAASAGEDRDIMLWDLVSSKRIAVCKGHTAPIWSIDMSGDGNILASGSADNSVRLWDMKMLRSPDAGNESQSKKPLLGYYPTKHTPVFSVSFTRRNLLLASGPYRPPPAVELNPSQLIQQPAIPAATQPTS